MKNIMDKFLEVLAYKGNLTERRQTMLFWTNVVW